MGLLRVKPVLQTWGRTLRGRVPSLSIEITKECPLRCPGCYAYEDAHLGTTNLRSLSDFKGQELIARVLDVMDRGLRAGAFPQVPGPDDSRPDRTSWENCLYCPFDRVCPTGRDQMRERKRDRPGPLIHQELGRAT